LGGDTQERSLNVLKKGGFMVSTLKEPSTELAAQYGIRGAAMLVHPDAEQLSHIAKLIDAGLLTVIAETVLPLAEARKAHELSQTGHVKGKIVLEVIKE
jgi:NADPH:quinone reductase-like Zn-dependent oxidoreductase